MYAPDPAFLAAIEARQVEITELYKIVLNNGIIRYFTTHDEDILWGTPSVRYQSLVPLARGEIETKMDLQAGQVELVLGNITSELAELVQSNTLDGAVVTIKRIVYSLAYGSGMEMTLFVGTADASFNRKVLTLICTSFLDSLNMVVPKNIYQEPCNNRLYDETCEVIKAAFAINGAASSDSTDYYTLTDIANIGPLDDNYLALGEVYITSGENIGNKRFVREQVGPTVSFSAPLPYMMKFNDTFIAYPGCDKRPSTCRDKFLANEANFNGYIYIPKPEETMF